jgi:hypothetical protein
MEENVPVLDPAQVDEVVDEMIEDGIEPLELDELGLDRETIIEYQSVVAAQHIRDAHSIAYTLAANRAVKNTEEVTRLDKVDRAARTALAKIKRDYPEAIVLAKEHIKREADQVRKNRQQQSD